MRNVAADLVAMEIFAKGATEDTGALGPRGLCGPKVATCLSTTG